jgi:hypothetical protein
MFSDKNKLLLAVTVVVLAVVLILAYQNRYVIRSRLPIGGIAYSVKTIKVMQGHEFDIILANGKRLHCLLKVQTPLEAKDKVIAYINNCSKPRVKLYRQRNQVWEIDLIFAEGSLTNWLYQQNLVWEL